MRYLVAVNVVCFAFEAETIKLQAELKDAVGEL